MKRCTHCNEETRYPILGLCSCCAPYLAAHHADEHVTTACAFCKAYDRETLRKLMKIAPAVGSSARGLATAAQVAIGRRLWDSIKAQIITASAP